MKIDLSPLGFERANFVLDSTADLRATVFAGRIVGWQTPDGKQAGSAGVFVAPEVTDMVATLVGQAPDGSYPLTSTPGPDTLARPVPNPYARGSFNLTRQLEMQRENPALADRLRDAAGH